ncbi:MAG: ABC-F family ATP-binding cassette domain-containing protein [Proteobacteria bacterium]|nr:ABC-F family ATP-binding cassette domain-containing protein [Pseudomonadota bacterium]MBI3500041.1 ABC-F family ATP-binding cassette domain-containing protein [Pseudomonadota bacterium]
MLHINGLVYRIGGRLLFDGATVAVPAGHHVGLVGRNGAGKSTLLKLILAEVQADAGTIRLPRQARIGAVAQEAPGGEVTPLEAVLAADTERATLMAEAETAVDPHRIAEVQTRLADIAAHAAPARAAEILAGLGFDQRAQARPLSDFSGGWRMRVALASQLFRAPDILLLDEPTNHLDLEATLWLEGFLEHYPGTLVLVSHDRELLNRVVGHILHLDSGKLRLYAGAYDAFLVALAEQRALEAASAAKQEAARKHMQAFVDRFRYKASKARQAQSRLKAIERLGPAAAIRVDPRAPDFHFPEPVALAPPLIAFDGVSVGYEPGRPILRNIGLNIDPDDRIALLGANGNGKTTFARLVAGRLKPMAGRQTRSSKLGVGFFAQHQLEELEPDRTPMQHLATALAGAQEREIRARLGRFGFGEQHVGLEVEKLSGGERARLSLCLISLAAPQLLILDEPTNHLDVDAREALVEALGEYSGAVILVSHDPHLVRLIADRLWLVADGTVRDFEGDVDDYRNWLLEQGRAERRAGREAAQRAKAKAEALPKATAEPVKERPQRPSRERLQALRRRARKAEESLSRLTAERAEIESALADPATYQGGGEKVATLTRRKGHIEREIAETERSWLEASEALEAAE